MTRDQNRDHEPGRREYAGIAGVSYAVIILGGIFAEFFVRGRVVVDGDAAATAANIMAAESLFRLGFAADLVMIVCDVVVAWALFGLFATVNRSLAGLAAAFRLVHAAVLGANLLHHFAALLVLAPAGGTTGVMPTGAPSLALLAIEAHGHGYLIAQVFFAIHCFLIGILVFRARSGPRVLAILLGLAGLGYLVESGIRFLAPRLEAATEPGLVVAGIAEVGFAIWLAYLGTRRPHPGALEEEKP